MTSTSTLDLVADAIRETLHCGPVDITRATTANDVRGWDSLSHTMILMAVEDAFGLTLPEDRIFGLNTVGDLVDLVDDVKSTAASA